MRAGRDPEHDPAHHRPTRRTPRPAVRQDTHGHDPQPAPRPGPRLRRLPAVDSWHPDGPATYVLTISDAEAAAPAATRALVAAGADVLSIGESHHSLGGSHMTGPEPDLVTAGAAWSAAAEMDPFETVMGRSAADPRLRSTADHGLGLS